jgi:hypothetical protein
MTELDFMKLGFALRGDGTLRAPAGSRITLVIEGAFVKLTLALANGKHRDLGVAELAQSTTRRREAMSNPKSEIPLTAIVKLVEYLDPSEERRHFEDMQRDGEDTSNHVWLSIKAVTEWLDSQGIPYRDPTAELKQAVAGEFAKHGIKVEN